MVMKPMAKFMLPFLSLAYSCNSTLALSARSNGGFLAPNSVEEVRLDPHIDIEIKFRAAVTEFQTAFDELQDQENEWWRNKAVGTSFGNERGYTDDAGTHMAFDHIRSSKWYMLNAARSKLAALSEGFRKRSEDEIVGADGKNAKQSEEGVFLVHLKKGLYKDAAVKQMDGSLFDPLLSKPRPQYEVVLNESRTKVKSVVFLDYEGNNLDLNQTASQSGDNSLIDQRTSYFVMGGHQRYGEVIRTTEYDPTRRSKVYRVVNDSGMLLTRIIEIKDLDKLKKPEQRSALSYKRNEEGVWFFQEDPPFFTNKGTANYMVENRELRLTESGKKAWDLLNK